MTMPLHELTIAQASERIRRRTLSPVELTEALLQRIEAVDPQLDAFIAVTAERALRDAKRAEVEISQGRWRGPLHGIPYGLKDVYNTAGIATTAHSKVAIDHVPAQDSAVVQKLVEGGGVLLGKLATFQFTHGGPSFDPPWPPARNPWNTDHNAGGSSSGSAAAVAAGLVLGAMGTDTGGSVRIPAAFCGLAGLKPSSGLVSRRGVIPNSWSFDHCGPLARTVEDCAILLQAIAGFDALDPSSVAYPACDYRASLAGRFDGLRVGVLRHFWEENLRLHDAVPPALERALEVFRALGAQVEDARIRPLQDYYDVKNVITKSEVYCVHQRDLGERPADFGPDFLGITLPGCLFQAIDYVQAQRERTSMIGELDRIFERYDVLLAPNAGPAPVMARKPSVELWQAESAPSSLCIPFSMSGGPALAVSIGFTADGLPMGMQLAARPGRDALLLRVGHAYESVTRWHDARPSVPEAAMKERDASSPSQRAPETTATRSASTDDGLTPWLAERAGLRLDDASLGLLRAVDPHVLAMSTRLRRPRPWAVEGSNVFELESGSGEAGD